MVNLEQFKPLECDLCKEEIKENERFIDFGINLGVKEGDGYLKGQFYWDTKTRYIHLRHLLIEKVGT